MESNAACLAHAVHLDLSHQSQSDQTLFGVDIGLIALSRCLATLGFLDPLCLGHGQARTLLVVELGLLDPVQQHLWHAVNLGAIDSTEAHGEEYFPRGSCTMRTARSRTSGGSLFDFFMAPSSQRWDAHQNRGDSLRRINFDSSRHVAEREPDAADDMPDSKS